ncbi:MAG: hypothetical protein K940chlam8_00125 [Chlamydiae bacterium]|nr:hypothetical protein [Chlamydiota bacterium]
MSGLEAIAYQSALLTTPYSSGPLVDSKLRLQPLTKGMQEQLRSSTSFQELIQEVQAAYPQGAQVRVSSRGIFVKPEGDISFIPFESQQDLTDIHSIRRAEVEQLVLHNLQTVSDDYTKHGILKGIKDASYVTKTVSFAKKVVRYTLLPTKTEYVLKSVGYLSAARSSIKTFEYFRDAKNAHKTQDMRRVAERVFLSLSAFVGTVNSASSATLGTASIIGKELPKLFVSGAAITSFASSFLSLLYTGYKLGHECMFAHDLKQQKTGISEKEQATKIWEFFQKRVRIDVGQIKQEVMEKNGKKTLEELHQEVSKLHKRSIPFNLNFDKSQKTALFEDLESHVKEMLKLSSKQEEKRQLLLNYMVILKSELQQRKLDKRLSFHTGTTFVELVHQYASADMEKSSESILRAHDLIQKESSYKKYTYAAATVISLMSLTAATLACLVTFAPALVPAFAITLIPILSTTSSVGSILYAIQAIIHQVGYDTYKPDIKDSFKGVVVKKEPFDPSISLPNLRRVYSAG